MLMSTSFKMSQIVTRRDHLSGRCGNRHCGMLAGDHSVARFGADVRLTLIRLYHSLILEA